MEHEATLTAKSIKMSDALLSSAESIISMGRACGLEIGIFDIYNKSTAKDLALIARLMIDIISTSKGLSIEVTND